jgi:hypothetical protein
MIKLLLVTWSYEDYYDLKNTFIYKSFIINNSENLIHHVHFNRNNYQELEKEFNLKFGFQYEYILYKIFLLKKKITDIESEYLIYSDTNDVVCLGNIQEINLDVINKVIFSSESHMYPSQNELIKWGSTKQYPEEDIKNKKFLNSGLYIGKKENIINMMSFCINEVLPLEYKNFGGDQGIYIYTHLNNYDLFIELDDNFNMFLSTYLRSENDFIKENNKLKNRVKSTYPLFVHDNGWNYGSPRFIEKFNLI